MKGRACCCAAALVAVALAPAAGASPPAPAAPLPQQPERLARTVTRTASSLEAAIDRWRSKASKPPADVTLYALYQQRAYRLLARQRTLAAATIRLLPRTLALVSQDLLAAHRALYRITPAIGVAIRVSKAAPAATLLRYYREAERRFGVPWTVLAAVNFVETKFGKLRSTSAAGAQGPMQFIPATWRRYGLGGNVHAAHDAILGAANYLHASGAPQHLRNALHHYNPSSAYVDAVLRYARRIGADRTMFYALYCWQVFVKTPRGDHRVTGPGLP